VWCRIEGDELVIVARHGDPPILGEIARHELSTPGHPRICDEHYPHHQTGNGPHEPRPSARTDAEAEFLALGEGAHRWLIEAAATGAQRVRSKMARAVELAGLYDPEAIDDALGIAAVAGRFGDTDLVSILEHRRTHTGVDTFTATIDEAHSTQPGTSAWEGFGR
jgi:hypothetical protein